MPLVYENTYVPIRTVTLSSNSASISISDIPPTYTDLILRVSLRSNRSVSTPDGAIVRFNGDTTSGNYTGGRLFTTGTSKTIDSTEFGLYANGNTSTASIFSNVEMVMYNYTSSRAKSCITQAATPNHGGSNGTVITEDFVWSGTSAISSMVITPEGGTLFLAGSTVSLYGVGGSLAQTSAKASGGTVVRGADGYIYHYLTAVGSNSFVVSSAITADILLLGGGGAGGGIAVNGTGNGGGGAGGFAAYTSQSLSATTYSISIGAGGVGGSSTGGNGGNTTFTGLTAAVGGGGGGTRSNLGNTGGSGGGSGSENTNTPAQGTAGQGFAGGTGAAAPNYGGGGGGGAGGAGVNGSGTVGGNGGIPKQWLDGFYYGPGGGGGVYNGGTAGLGGRISTGIGAYAGNAGAVITGSGGNVGSPAWSNYGGGGGGSSNAPSGGANGGNGGSGLVVIRYQP